MKLARVASISAVLVQEGLGYLTSSEAPGDEHEAPGPDVAVRLRRTLEKLGPTFVKFGQLLSTRVDLFDEDFCAEMAKLQSEVEPFDTAEARRIVEAELERPIDEVFSSFSEQPIAAASIAQVYRATLASDGADVAVKVQRPNLEQSLFADLDALITLSRNIDRLVPPYRRSMVHRMAEEYAARARMECDFLAEARAIRQFGEVLATLPEFRVPELYPSLSTPRLLVMEWLDGTKLGDLASGGELLALGFDPDSFGRSMLRLQLSMCYEHGFVHGDTHPGNIILLPSGQIGLIDFGLHGHVPKALREKMLEMVFSQASGQVDDAVEAFVQVFHPDPTADLDAFKAQLHDLLAEGAEGGAVSQNRITREHGRRHAPGSALRTAGPVRPVHRDPQPHDRRRDPAQVLPEHRSHRRGQGDHGRHPPQAAVRTIDAGGVPAAAAAARADAVAAAAAGGAVAQAGAVVQRVAQPRGVPAAGERDPAAGAGRGGRWGGWWRWVR